MWWAMREYALHSPTFVQQYTRNTPATPATPLPTPKKTTAPKARKAPKPAGVRKPKVKTPKHVELNNLDLGWTHATRAPVNSNRTRSDSTSRFDAWVHRQLYGE